MSLVITAESGKEFHTNHGKIRTLSELLDGISTMSDHEFHEHVNDQKNDFASWIRYVLEQESLAHNLYQVTSKQQTLALLRDFIYGKKVIEEKIVQEKTVQEKTVQEKTVQPEPSKSAQKVTQIVHKNDGNTVQTKPKVRSKLTAKPLLSSLSSYLPKNMDTVFVFLEGLVVGMIITYIVFTFIL